MDNIERKIQLQFKDKIRYKCAIGFGYVYMIQQEYLDIYKIGFSNEVIDRIISLQGANPFELRIYRLFAIAEDQLTIVEKFLHSYFESKNIRGEWYRLSVQDCSQITKEWLKQKIPHIIFDETISFEDEMVKSDLSNFINYLISIQKLEKSSSDNIISFPIKEFNTYIKNNNISDILCKKLRENFKNKKILIDDIEVSDQLIMSLDDILLESITKDSEFLKEKESLKEKEESFLNQLKLVDKKLLEVDAKFCIAFDLNYLGRNFKKDLVKFITDNYGKEYIFSSNHLVRFKTPKRCLLINRDCMLIKDLIIE